MSHPNKKEDAKVSACMQQVRGAYVSSTFDLKVLGFCQKNGICQLERELDRGYCWFREENLGGSLTSSSTLELAAETKPTPIKKMAMRAIESILWAEQESSRSPVEVLSRFYGWMGRAWATRHHG